MPNQNGILTYKPNWYIIKQKGGFPMTNYKRPYFRLFCAVCDTIDALEQTAASKNCPETTAKLLSEQAKQLRKVTQETEELVIGSDS
jgi:reverse gyrase